MEGDQLLLGAFTESQLDRSDLTVIAARSPVAEEVAVRVASLVDGHNVPVITDNPSTKLEDQYAAGQKFVIESLVRRKSHIPEHLVVVIDGSASTKEYVGDLQSSLSKLPGNVRASLIVATHEQEEFAQPIELSQGLKKLSEVHFVGGQDNLKAVVKAAELAGEDRGGAVLWIHGPQSVQNRELYIIPPYVATPAFYELSLDSGETDIDHFFKNHSEIGPFAQVPHCGSVSADLEHYFSKWMPNSDEYSVTLAEANAKSSRARALSGQEAQEILALHAHQECLKLIACRNMRAAARTAVANRLVTPVSSALVTEPRQAVAFEGVSQTTLNPQLQGAANGTIGPQMDDATFVTGVNTAGSVRVNNLANLEALFGLIANGLEILGIAWGGPTMIMGFMHMSSGSSGAMKRILFGAAGVAAGLAMPGSINWLIASARDANLFS